MKNGNFYDGVALGIAISSSLILVSLWAADLPSGDFQTNFIPLLTTAATLAAGYLAVSAATRTIKAQTDHLAEARLNKLEAARSTLPLVLSRVIDIARAHLRALTDGTGAIQLPHLDSESITTLKECIETTSGITRTTLQELIAAYQICRSRHDEVSGFLPATKNTDDYECYLLYKRAIDWISLESLATVLFDFSRGRAERPMRDEAREYAIRQTEIFVYETTWDHDIGQKIVEAFNKQKESSRFSFADPGWLDVR